MDTHTTFRETGKWCLWLDSHDCYQAGVQERVWCEAKRRDDKMSFYTLKTFTVLYCPVQWPFVDTEHLESGRSKLRYAISVKYPLDSEDLI